MSAKHLFKNIFGQPVVKSPSLFFLACGKTQREWQDSDAGGAFPFGDSISEYKLQLDVSST